jgi:hypothetical protein
MGISAVVISALCAAGASADILYNATDFNGTGGTFANNYASDNFIWTNFVVDDITVPSGGWTIDTLSVYCDHLLGGDEVATEAYLVVFPKSLGLENVNALDYATLVSVTQTPEDFHDPNAFIPDRTLQRIDASGLNLTLAADEYWIGLTPVGESSDPWGSWSSYTENGDIGMQYAVRHDEWYAIGSSGYGWGPDTMMKIQGVPEPSSLALLATVGMSAVAHRRRGR